MIKIYGSMMCPDCVKCRKDLENAGVKYVYLDFADSLRNLKEFLVLREEKEAFCEIKVAGKIGIPCIVAEDGTVSLSWEEYM